MKNYEFLSINQSNFHFIELDIKNNVFYRNLYLAINLPLKCKKLKPDVFFLVDTQAIFLKPCKLVSTIHDLAEFVVPEKYSRMRAFIRRCIVRNQIKKSDHIITVSQYSKNDICSRFGVEKEKVTVVYNSVEEPKINELQEPDDYILYVSEIERAKNLRTLIRSYVLLPGKIKSKYKLFVVGKKGNDYENVVQLIKDNEIEDRVHFFGFVSDDELKELYSKAYCFVFPSLFEGFGLPVLEAMAKGTPVICSNSSSIPEVGGSAVLTFDPLDENELMNQIVKLINDNSLRESMIFNGLERAKLFNKTNAARNTLRILLDD